VCAQSSSSNNSNSNIKLSAGQRLKGVLISSFKGLAFSNSSNSSNNNSASQQLAGTNSPGQDNSNSSASRQLAGTSSHLGQDSRRSSTGGMTWRSRRFRSSSGAGWGSARPSAAGILAEDEAVVGGNAMGSVVVGYDGVIQQSSIGGGISSNRSSSGGGSSGGDDTQSALGDDAQVTSSVEVTMSLLPHKFFKGVKGLGVTGGLKAKCGSEESAAAVAVSYKDCNVWVRGGHKMAKRLRQAWGKVV
jgi:hypothetical protein